MQKNSSEIAVLYWLFVNIFMVFSMIFIGGVTRLTDSGLSMIDWNLIKGIVPPLNESQWIEKFDDYKMFPEFKIYNSDMEIDEFKKIFFWEYLHRVWGRLIGLTFLIPLFYFYFTKKITKKTSKYLFFVTLVGFFQAFMGWYMVRSGLIDKPDVSQYRLASHLITALIIYSLLCFLFWNLYRIKIDKNLKASVIKKRSLFELSISLFLIFLTITSGAFVAGTDAGVIYNNFPLMGKNFLPPDPFLLEPKWVNFFENMPLIQFNHRVIATITGLTIVYTSIRNLKYFRDSIIGILLRLLLIFITIQYILGVVTLKYAAPVVIGSMHQMGSIVVLTILVIILSEIFLKKKGAIV
tara:strand:- start:3651 stop:4706 length:1056 start_codon:yes stop_codon:yes gene_type:complete